MLISDATGTIDAGFFLVVLNGPDTARVCLEAAAHIASARDEARIGAADSEAAPAATRRSDATVR